MRKAVLLLLLVSACSGGGAETTTSTSTTAPSTTTTSTTTTTTTTSTTTSTSTTTTTLGTPPDFVTYDGFGYSLAHPPEWTVNPDFPGPGVGFLASNAGIGLPPTQFSISIELLDAPIDLAEYGQNVRDDYAAIALNYQLLDEGAGEIDSNPSVYYEFVETILGVDQVHRVEIATIGTLLVTVDLLAPVEAFEFEAARAADVVAALEFE